jgi:hypothetical protein
MNKVSTGHKDLALIGCCYLFQILVGEVGHLHTTLKI